jgi:hypothetical protein
MNAEKSIPELPSDVPEDIRALINRCLSKEMVFRYNLDQLKMVSIV